MSVGTYDTSLKHFWGGRVKRRGTGGQKQKITIFSNIFKNLANPEISCQRVAPGVPFGIQQKISLDELWQMAKTAWIEILLQYV